MSLPASLAAALEELLGPVRGAVRVHGGSICQVLRVEAPAGAVFVKYADAAPQGLFAVEAAGLQALRGRTGEVVVPEVLAVHDPTDLRTPALRWLVLEWLEPGQAQPTADESLGRGIAILHSAAAPGWGWDRPGFIGSLPQDNSPCDDWPTFWWHRRLDPQLTLAERLRRLPGTRALWHRLADLLPELLRPAADEGPSPLHGDLWAGNVLRLAGGRVALVDPSFHHGHREVDLAMCELFGGFSPAFHAAYREARPLQPGYDEVRREVYQLYFLLVHVNLFGGAYRERTARSLERILSTR